jgi:AcrR family transcriptional regulator
LFHDKTFWYRTSMDNPSRSERTRNAAIQAALAIIARDGPGRLTLDAIARESGISKGGLTHQFPTKRAVLQALLDRQIEHFDAFSRAYAAQHGAGQQPRLAAQIATMREAIARPDSVAVAILGAAAEDPSLLAATRKTDLEVVAAIKAEAADPDLALVRWMAARGLILSSLLGNCPLLEEERARLFERLLDDRRWSSVGRTKTRTGRASPAREAKRRKEK